MSFSRWRRIYVFHESYSGAAKGVRNSEQSLSFSSCSRILRFSTPFLCFHVLNGHPLVTIKVELSRGWPSFLIFEEEESVAINNSLFPTSTEGIFKTRSNRAN